MRVGRAQFIHPLSNGQTTVKTQCKEVLPSRHREGQKNERPSAILLHKGQTQFNSIGMGGWGGAISASGCTLRVSNGKGPFSSALVKGEGWSQKEVGGGGVGGWGGAEKKKLFWSFYMLRLLRCSSETIKATADRARVKRSSSAPSFFWCPCEISLGGFNDLRMSAFSVTLTPVAAAWRRRGGGGGRVMYCVLRSSWGAIFNVTASVDLSF